MVKDLHNRYQATQPPFRAERFCELTNVRIERSYLSDCDARLMRVRDGWVAEVSVDVSSERHQFALCHEVGHTFFSPSDVGMQSSVNCSMNSIEGKGEEQLCNLAAAEMLMPTRLFTRAVAGKPIELATVWSLSRTFGVSAQAVLSRIIDLDLWEVLVASFYAVDTTYYDKCFYPSHWRASKSAFSNYLRPDVVMKCLEQMARTDMSAGPLGILEAYTTGHPIKGEFTIQPVEKRFSIESFKNSFSRTPTVLSMVARHY